MNNKYYEDYKKIIQKISESKIDSDKILFKAGIIDKKGNFTQEYSALPSK